MRCAGFREIAPRSSLPPRWLRLGWFADLKHKASPARRAKIARAAKAEVAPAMTKARMERLKAKGWRSGSAADFLTPQLVEARYVRDFVIWLRFADGREGEVDLAGELQGPIFEPLREVDYFRRFALDRSLHTIAWPAPATISSFAQRHCEEPSERLSDEATPSPNYQPAIEPQLVTSCYRLPQRPRRVGLRGAVRRGGVVP